MKAYGEMTKEELLAEQKILNEEYQKYLEKEWLKRLKSKYKYKINKKVLKTVSLD